MDAKKYGSLLIVQNMDDGFGVAINSICLDNMDGTKASSVYRLLYSDRAFLETFHYG